MRRLAASGLALSLLVLSAVPVLGAVDQTKLKEIKALTQQMYSIKAQIIDTEVEAGVLDQAKAEIIKKAMQERQQRVEQDIDKGVYPVQRHKKGCGLNNSNGSPSAQKTE